MTTRAAIYTRISQARGDDSDGVERQSKECHDYAASRGLDVVAYFEDNNLSAYKGAQRPQFEAMLKAIESGEVDAVIVWRQDRLTRQPMELERYATVCRTRSGEPVITHTVTGGDPFDLNAPNALMLAGMMAQVARYESDTKRARAESKARQLASQGRWTGGRRPFGWTVDEAGYTHLHPTEAPLIRSACIDFLNGKSMSQLTREWNAAGVTTTAGRPWTSTVFRMMLVRPRNAGRYVFKGEVVSGVSVPAAVEEDTWLGVMAKLNRPEYKGKYKTNVARHLTSGIARCHCGGKLTPTTGTGSRKPGGGYEQRTVYRCTVRGPGHVGRVAEYVDLTVMWWVWIYFSLERDHAQMTASEDQEQLLAELRAERASLDQREAELGRSFAEGLVSLDVVKAFAERARSARESMDARRGAIELDPTKRLGPFFPHYDALAWADLHFTEWKKLPLDQRREWIKERFSITAKAHGEGTKRVFNPKSIDVQPLIAGALSTDAWRPELTWDALQDFKQFAVEPDTSHFAGYLGEQGYEYTVDQFLDHDGEMEVESYGTRA